MRCRPLASVLGFLYLNEILQYDEQCYKLCMLMTEQNRVTLRKRRHERERETDPGGSTSFVRGCVATGLEN